MTTNPSNEDLGGEDEITRLKRLVEIAKANPAEPSENEGPARWQTTDHGQYVEVTPLTDTKQHLAGDECWCNPEVERKPGSRPLISHNEVTTAASPDHEPTKTKRERYEQQ